MSAGNQKMFRISALWEKITGQESEEVSQITLQREITVRKEICCQISEWDQDKKVVQRDV